VNDEPAQAEITCPVTEREPLHIKQITAELISSAVPYRFVGKLGNIILR
jgi:hypothetical protein